MLSTVQSWLTFPGMEGVEKLVGFWKRAASTDLFESGLLARAKRVASLKAAIHETHEMRKIIEEAIHPDTLFEDLPVPFQCVAASVEKFAEHWFDSGPVVDACTGLGSGSGALSAGKDRG